MEGRSDMLFKFSCAELRAKFEKLGMYEMLRKNLAVPPSYTTLRCNTLRKSPQQILDEVRLALAQVSEQQFEASLHPVIPDLIVIVNQGPSVRETLLKEVIVDRFCGMAVIRGSDIFASGLLAMSGNIVEDDVVSVYVDVDSVCLKGSLPPYQFNRIHLGNGVAKISRQKVYSGSENQKLGGVGVEMTDAVYISPKLNGFLPEMVFAQNLPSCLCSHILDPKPGDTVLDMCAAPGGKTSHIASLMRNQGILIALDKAKKKIDRIKENLKRTGCTIAQVYAYDSISAVKEASIESSDHFPPHQPPYLPGSFDKILLDAPCSALGQRPSLGNPMTSKELSSYPRLQRKLITAAVSLLKSGGTLVYSTCTFHSEENEEQISWLLNTYPEMCLQSQGPFHLCKASAEAFQPCGLSEDQLSKLQLFHPAFQADERSFDTDTIGFFIAKLIKV